MTTQINVTVDSGGLLERSRQQQTANRQAFAEGEQRTSAEQTGTEQRQKRLTAEGRNANGDLFPGRRPQLNRYRQEPAANRRETEPFLLLRPSGDQINGTVPLIHRGFLSQLSVESGQLTYDLTGGPNGSPAYVAASALDTDRVFLRGYLPFVSGTGKYASGTKDFTLQFYFKFGTTFTLYQSSPIVTVQVGPDYLGPSIQRDFVKFSTSLYSPFDDYTGYFLDYATSYTDLYIGDEPLDPATSTSPLPGVWHHVAIVKKGLYVTLYMNGITIQSDLTSWGNFVFLSADVANLWFTVEFGCSLPYNVEYQPVSIHGIRFDPKALYTSNFIPPPSL